MILNICIIECRIVSELLIYHIIFTLDQCYLNHTKNCNVSFWNDHSTQALLRLVISLDSGLKQWIGLVCNTRPTCVRDDVFARYINGQLTIFFFLPEFISLRQLVILHKMLFRTTDTCMLCIKMSTLEKSL